MTTFNVTSLGVAGAIIKDVSDDGRFVSYVVEQNGFATLYVRDLTDGSTATVDTSPTSPGGGFGNPAQGIDGGALSADGRYIFYSTGDMDGEQSLGSSGTHLWIRDLQTGAPATDVTPEYPVTYLPNTTIPAITSLLGLAALDISADGQHVLYSATYTDLTSVVPDFEGGAVLDVTDQSDIRIPNSFAEFVTLTPDGRFVTYLQPNGVPPYMVVVDTQTGTSTRYGDGVLGISDDGRYVAYDLNDQVWVQDRQNPSLFGTLVSQNVGGVAADANSSFIAISGDGRHVAFSSTANNLVANDADGDDDIFIKNLDTGSVTRVAAPDGGQLWLSFDGTELVSSTGNVYKAAPPTLTITEISADGYINAIEAGLPVTVKGTSDAIGEIVHITSPNGTPATALVKADGTWTASFVDATGVAEGIHNFTADVADDFGLHGTATKSADFDYTPPDLRLFAVAGDNIVSRSEKAAINFDGFSDAIGQQISLSIDHQLIAKVTVTADGKWGFVYNGTNMADGQHEVEYSAADAAGNFIEHSFFFDKVTPHNVAPTFYVGGGVVITPVGEAHSASASGLAIQADGKIVVGGSEGSDLFSMAAVRYGTDGQLDASFGNGGIVIGKFGDAFSVAVQADGKIILGGSSAISTTFELQRFNADGTLDLDFGTNGLVETPVETYASALSIVLDGTKIIAVGQAAMAPTYDTDFALVRYLAGGSLDSTFGNGGIVTTDFGTQFGQAEVAMSVVVQSDGKIVVGGETGNGNEGSFTLARYNDNGTLDVNFGTGGKVVTDLSSQGASVGQIQMLADGKILVAGGTYDGSHYDFELARYNTNGFLDTSFSGDGKLTTSLVSGDDRATSVIIQSDGKIVVAGWALISESDPNAAHEFALIRYNANGSIDTTFGDGGVVLTEIGLWSEGVGVKLQTDGKIVIAGTTINADLTSRNFAVARYNSDGSLDPTFGGINSLGNAVSYTEGGDPVVLDAIAKIFDADLAGLNNGNGNYGGTSVTLARSGGANTDDVFGASGSLALTGSNVVFAGVTVGTFTQSAGQLAITFADGATQAQVNGVLDAITYANTHDFANGTTTPVQIAWTFSDGNSGLQGIGGPATTAGVTNVDIIAPTFNDVTITTDTQASTLAGINLHNLVVNAGATLTIDAALPPKVAGGSITNNGTILVNGQALPQGIITTLDYTQAAHATLQATGGAAVTIIDTNTSPFTNLAADGTLTGGIYIAQGQDAAQHGSTITITGDAAVPVTTLAGGAKVVLDGEGTDLGSASISLLASLMTLEAGTELDLVGRVDSLAQALTNGGTIAAGAGEVLTLGGVIANSGGALVADSGKLVLADATLQGGTLSAANDGSIAVTGAVTLIDTVELAAGAITNTGTLGGAGTLKIDAGATLIDDGSIGAGVTLSLAAPDGAYAGASIDLTAAELATLFQTAVGALAPSSISADIVGGKLVVHAGQSAATVASVTALPAGDMLAVTPDGHGGVNIAVAASTADTTSPTVTINQAAGQSDPVGGSPLLFDVVFSEPVTDFTAEDITLSGTAGATGAVVAGSGTTYAVGVFGMTQQGTVVVSIAPGVAHDAANNANLASTSTDNTVQFTGEPPVLHLTSTTLTATMGLAAPLPGIISVTDLDSNWVDVILQSSDGVNRLADNVSEVGHPAVVTIGPDDPILAASGLVAGEALELFGTIEEVNTALAFLGYDTSTIGTDTITAVAVDDAGNLSAPQHIAVTVNPNLNQAPVVHLASTTLTETTGTVAPLAGITVTDPDSDFVTVFVESSYGFYDLTATPSGALTVIQPAIFDQLFIDGVFVGNIGSGLAISGQLADVNATLASLQYRPSLTGTDTIIVLADDGLGGKSAPERIAITVTAPQVTVALANDTDIQGDGVTSVPTITGSAGADTVVTISEGAMVLGTATADGTGVWTFTPVGLADGTHTLTATETDLAGNTSSAAVTFTVDTTAVAPLVALAIDSGMAGDGITNIGTVNVSGLEAGASWQYSVNGGAYVAGSGNSFTVTGDGPKAVLVHQTDAAGNTSADASLAFTLDTTAAAPLVALATDSGIAGDGITRIGTVNVSGLESGAAYEYAVNGGGFVTGTGSSFTLTGDGPKTVLVHQTDAAGNVSTDTSLTMTLDSQAPDTTITAQPAALTNSASASFSWSGTDTAGGSGVVSYQYQLDGLGWTATNSTSQAFSGLSDGSHSFKVEAIDAAGNIDSSPASFDWTVDTHAPAPLIASELFNKNGSATLAGTSEANSTIKIFDGGTQIGTATTTASGSWTFTTGKESNAIHTFSVTGTDAAGNAGTGAGVAIYGSTGNDTITGAGGNDLIAGAAGSDNLTGGLGNDIFAYAATGDSKPAKAAFDTIADFVHGSDKLDFSAIAGLNSNNQNVAINIINNGSTPQSIAAHTIDVVITGSNAIIYANAGNNSQTISNGHEDMQINLTGVTIMSASDFILHP